MFNHTEKYLLIPEEGMAYEPLLLRVANECWEYPLGYGHPRRIDVEGGDGCYSVPVRFANLDGDDC